MNASAPSPPPPAARLHALDGLRAFAMLLGVVLHAAVPYMRKPMEGLLWPVVDAWPHVAFDGLFWVLHVFRVPLFFVVAGFFAHLLLASRGPRAFALHRAKRILLPLALAVLTILPLTYAAWCWGWLATGRISTEELTAWKFVDGGIQFNLRGPGHLWFLIDLLIFSALVIPILAWWPRLLRGPRIRAAWQLVAVSRVAPLVLAVPTGLILWWRPDAFTTFHNSFTPGLASLFYHGWFFTVGVLLYPLHRHGVDLGTTFRHGPAMLVIAMIPLAVLVQIVVAERGLSEAEVHGPTIAICISTGAWLLNWGLLGTALKLWRGGSAALRLLADSAYWVYLTHVPVVGLLHVALDGAAWPTWTKFLAACAGAFAVTLVSYRAFVRFTWLGALLNGRRGRGRDGLQSPPHEPPDSSEPPCTTTPTSP